MNSRLMTQAKAKPGTSFTPAQSGLLQRNCSCGGSASSSLTGDCEECKKKRLQKKLTIGASNDPPEQEADRVADQVLTAPANREVSSAPPRIQRFTGQATRDIGTAPASVDRVLARTGRPLDPALQQDMGERFGYDFSDVRVHTGAEAEESARDVNARAYTVGHNVVFGARQFAPQTHEGRKLLAHELTHAVQQTASPGGGVSRASIKVARKGGWKSDSGVGAWNKDSHIVAGVARIPIEDVAQGYQNHNMAAETKEDVTLRAIALVPVALDFKKNIDVLLHFHGHNIGYREGSTAGTSGPAGTVRDVEADQIEQQMAAANKNLIAILPQGTTDSHFRAKGAFDPQSYVKDVLTKLVPLIPFPVPLGGKIELGRVIVSGHSGGGPEAVHSANLLNPIQPYNRKDPFKDDVPLLLFDAINGPNELTDVKNLLGDWIDRDVDRCSNLHPSLNVPDTLEKRGLRFRSTYSNSGTYVKNNKELEAFKNKKLTAISATTASLGIQEILPKQYIIQPVGGSHDRTMATGLGINPDKKARDLSTGIPNYTAGTGNLEKALGALYPQSSPASEPPVKESP